MARAEALLRRRRVLAEDGSRSDVDFLVEVCQLAVSNGATTLNIPDTVGYGVPEEYAALIRHVIESVDGEFVVSTHCHNDLGLAVANSLAGVAARRSAGRVRDQRSRRAGRQRRARRGRDGAAHARPTTSAPSHTTVKTEELARTSRMVARLTGYPVQYNKAIIGRNAFAHEAGIHQHGVLEDRETYEIIDASTVGQEAAQIVLGKHSGRHAFADSLEKLGLHVQGDALNQAFTRFKELADRKVEITEADLEAIVAEELGIGTVHRFTLASLELRGGTDAMPTAHVVLGEADGKVYFPELDSPFYRVTYLSNYSPKMTPPGDHFSLLAEVSVSRFKQENADDVVERTIAGMVSSKLLTPEQAKSKIVSRQLLRVPYSYPVPTTGRDRALAAIHPWLTEQGIYSRGRFGAWRYEIGNTDHCVMQGVELAEFLARGTPERTWALLPGEESRARIS